MFQNSQISEEQARRLWARAAELQAQALARRDPDDSRVSTEHADTEPDAGYALEQVREAAREAGISVEYMDRALAEAERGMLLEPRRSDGFVDAYLGPGPIWLEVDEVVNRPVSEAFESLRRVAERLQLNLVRTYGGEVGAGGVLVFERGGVEALMRHKLLQDLYNASIGELHVSLSSVQIDQCRIRIGAPLTTYRRVMAWFGVSVNMLTAIGAGFAAAAMAPGALATLPGALVGAAFGFPVAGLVTLAEHRAWRAMHRWGERSGRRGLEALLGMITTDVRTGGAFKMTEPSGAWPKLPEASGLARVDDLLDDLI